MVYFGDTVASFSGIGCKLTYCDRTGADAHTLEGFPVCVTWWLAAGNVYGYNAIRD